MASCDLESSSVEEEFVFISDDDSDEDPTFNILEETLRSRVSKISIKKSGLPPSSEGDDDDSGVEEESPEPMETDTADVVPPKLSKEDEKCFERVESLIKDGQLNKLKVDQCKIYLRKYGLRLTGNKEVLVGRIKEHLNIIDGGGEKIYPPSSFVLNCKGDACTGDVVMFEQNVYEMFSIVSRSATAPPCGTRIIAGRIVKESYGAAKQQHTFTIEVLWSKGEKPLLPLHPLLIKGRNLYRLKTLRQRWANEEERRKVLQEKHSRGSLARSSRDNRIHEKETRKIARAKRMIEKNSEQKILSDHVNKQKANQQKTSHVLQQATHQHELENQRNPLRMDTNQHVLQYQQKTNHVLQQVPHQQHVLQHQRLIHQPHIQQPQGLQYHLNPLQRTDQYVRPQFPVKLPQYQQACASATLGFQQRRPLSCLNSLLGPPHHQIQCQRQPCRFYREGRCRFGDNCKYLHDCT